MPFSIYFTDNSGKEFGRLDKTIQERIKAKLEKASSSPMLFVKRLKGVELFSLRAGNYRVILNIEWTSRKITVMKISLRKNVYNTL